MTDYHYMTTPVSASVSVTVVANGVLRAKHIRNLIKMLEIDLEYLTEDEARAPTVPVPVEEMPA